jgi:hypothetical protein
VSTWNFHKLCWTKSGVWVGSRQRWALDQTTRRRLEFDTAEEAEQAAADLQSRFPEERFWASWIPGEPLDRAAQKTEQQIANNKAYREQHKGKAVNA